MPYRRSLCTGALAALTLAVAGIACAQTEKDKTPAKPADKTRTMARPVTRAEPVALTVQTDKKTYTAQEPIKITIKVNNATRSTVTFRFSSGQKYDIELRRGQKPDGEKLWQWSQGRMFVMMLTSASLEPNKALVYTDTLKPTDLKNALTPGTYTLSARLTTMGRQPRLAGTATITIR